MGAEAVADPKNPLDNVAKPGDRKCLRSKQQAAGYAPEARKKKLDKEECDEGPHASDTTDVVAGSRRLCACRRHRQAGLGESSVGHHPYRPSHSAHRVPRSPWRIRRHGCETRG